MGNERVSKQNGVEALCSDCNTLEKIIIIIIIKNLYDSNRAVNECSTTVCECDVIQFFLWLVQYRHSL